VSEENELLTEYHHSMKNNCGMASILSTTFKLAILRLKIMSSSFGYNFFARS
jgi:hypothetical protein